MLRLIRKWELPKFSPLNQHFNYKRHNFRNSHKSVNSLISGKRWQIEARLFVHPNRDRLTYDLSL